MRDSTKVSVVLASFNGQKYLEEQLNSILLQTRPPDELIVSDDSSTDATLLIARSFAELAPFSVKVVENANRLGCTRNFNRALELSSGDIVFLADQDDVWFRNKIESSLTFVSDKNPLSTIHDVELVGDNLESSGQTILERLSLLGIGSNQHIKGCCTMVTRELLDIALPIPSNIAHDNFLNGIARRLDRHHLNPEVLMFYRIHHDNTSKWAVNSLHKVDRRYVTSLRMRSRLNRLKRARPGQPSPERIEDAIAERLRLHSGSVGQA